MTFGFFDLIIMLLAVSVLVASLFHRIRVPPILGYLLIGMLFGPFALAWVPDTHITRDLAELGVVFLLFTIGLEFSWEKLLAMRRDVFLLGSLEVLLAILATVVIGQLFGITKTQSFLIGGILAMSSTAIVSKQLSEQMELITPHGMRAMGILLFQDLAVIPLLIVIPALANSNEHVIWYSLSIAILKAIGVMVGIVLGGRWVFRPIFYLIARTRSVELFTLTALLVTLGTAWITNKSGLSLALGAFLAGMLLGETEFRHQIEADIRPFRDVLLGLFFVSIGMQMDWHVLTHSWSLLLLLFGALVILKIVLITVISRLSTTRLHDAFRTALILAQGGEFGFVILTLTLDYELLSENDAKIVLGALFLSMVLAPFLIRNNGRLAHGLFPHVMDESDDDRAKQIFQVAGKFKHHVILCGFGRLGQNVARLLTEFNIPYVALDLDAPRVGKALASGHSVSYGDASQRDILLAAGLMNADVVVVTFNDTKAACQVLDTVQSQSKKTPVVIRTSDDEEAEHCYSLGASAVIPEIFEASLSVSMHVLLMLKKPQRDVMRLMDQIRHDRYQILREIIPGEDTWDRDEADFT